MLESPQLRVECAPEQGFSITSLRDRVSGAEALWQWTARPVAPCSRALGPAGDASIETFIDVFVGAWFEMFPVVGYPAPGDPTSMLHGELVRLPWELLDRAATAVEAQVDTVRSPFRVRRRLELAGPELRIEETVENIGAEAAPYLWGHHPCLRRQTFAGGRLELAVAEAHIPAPAFDPLHAVLRPGERVDWPNARRHDGELLDLRDIPAEADGRHDHVCVTPVEGRARVTAPGTGRALTLEWDLEHFPQLLIWQNFRAPGGWPFWRGADTFALEFTSNPGRSVPDAQAAGAVRLLRAGERLEAATSVRWEAM